jgi:predicted transcriptional regulator
MGPVLTDHPDLLWPKIDFGASVSREEFYNYFQGSTHAHAIVIKNARKLTKELELAYLRQLMGFYPPRSWRWAPKQLQDAAEFAE